MGERRGFSRLTPSPMAEGHGGRICDSRTRSLPPNLTLFAGSIRMQLNRRTFAYVSGMSIAASQFPNGHASPPQRNRIAFLGTEVRQHSHAQHFLDRHAMGYTFGGRWQEPRFDIASVYLDQFPNSDLGKQRIAKYKLHASSTIEEALTLGTSKLAVDGVVIIAEHGDYPVNEKGQKRYPRYEWFKKVVKVFEDSGRSVPVFNDKHLSTVWSECQEMVDDSIRLNRDFHRKRA